VAAVSVESHEGVPDASNEALHEDTANAAKDAELVRTARADSDWLLQYLVRLANAGLEIGITINMGGFLVSGMLASGKKYLEFIAEQLDNGLAKSSVDMTATRSMMAEFFEDRGKIYTIEDPGPATYLHIRDAHYFHNAGKPMPSNGSFWWRARIAEVGGFQLGNFSAE